MNSRESKAHLVSITIASCLDAMAVFGGLMLALWIRFESGWVAVDPAKGVPEIRDQLTMTGVATFAFLITFRMLELYRRPMKGRFEDQIPRMVRAIMIGFVAYFAAQAALALKPEFSRIALAIGFGTVTLLVVLERYILYRIEWNLARHLPRMNKVLLFGNTAVALRLREEIKREPFLRSEVIGILVTRPDQVEDLPEDIPQYQESDLEALIDQGGVSQMIVTDLDIGHGRLVDLIGLCEDRFIQFRMVPDIFRTLTSGPEIQYIGGTPVLGTRRWPLDHASRRLMKRLVDILCAGLGLLVTAPLILLTAWINKRSSPGPLFYRQERCGENGRVFQLVKIRTMQADAEQGGRPGWTVPDDPRRTRLGGWLRKTNIDELPQLWNVLKGDMSLVGPRPERPFFVEQFKSEIDRYMHRHVYKPGITGWAQVHGLRGDTSISERIKYDLYYLENWSLSLDFKIILKTFFANKNAY